MLRLLISINETHLLGLGGMALLHLTLAGLGGDVVGGRDHHVNLAVEYWYAAWDTFKNRKKRSV